MLLWCGEQPLLVDVGSVRRGHEMWSSSIYKEARGLELKRRRLQGHDIALERRDQHNARSCVFYSIREASERLT